MLVRYTGEMNLQLWCIAESFVYFSIQTIVSLMQPSLGTGFGNRLFHVSPGNLSVLFIRVVMHSFEECFIAPFQLSQCFQNIFYHLQACLLNFHKVLRSHARSKIPFAGSDGRVPWLSTRLGLELRKELFLIRKRFPGIHETKWPEVALTVRSVPV